MDIIDSLIFTQGFVWGILLLKKPIMKYKLLGGVFLAVSAVYLLNYSLRTFGSDQPSFVFPAAVLSIGLLLSFSNGRIFSKMEWDQARFSWWLRLIISIILIILALSVDLSDYSLWKFTFIILAYGILSDFGNFLKKVKQKNYTGRFLDDPENKNEFIILTGSLLILVAGLILALPSGKIIVGKPSIQAFHILIAVVIFIAGYGSVTLKNDFVNLKKIQNKKSPESKQTEEILKLMENEKPYLDCELTLGKMAAMLSMSEYELSSILNEDMNINFHSLINEYRIKTVKEKLKKPTNRNYTIMASAYESGFNSKSTFYRIFKEYTGLTPKEFLEAKGG